MVLISLGIVWLQVNMRITYKNMKISIKKLQHSFKKNRSKTEILKEDKTAMDKEIIISKTFMS